MPQNAGYVAALPYAAVVELRLRQANELIEVRLPVGSRATDVVDRLREIPALYGGAIPAATAWHDGARVLICTQLCNDSPGARRDAATRIMAVLPERAEVMQIRSRRARHRRALDPLRLVLAIRTSTRPDASDTHVLGQWIADWLGGGDGVELETPWSYTTLEGDIPPVLDAMGVVWGKTHLERVEPGNPQLRRGATVQTEGIHLYVRGPDVYGPAWEQRARLLAEAALTTPVPVEYAILTTTKREDADAGSNLSLNIPFLAKTDGSRFSGLGRHRELVDEPFLWQLDGADRRNAWVGSVADWWTQEATAAMQTSQQQPLYNNEDRRNGRGAVTPNRPWLNHAARPATRLLRDSAGRRETET